ncbi:MAG: acyl-CoA thioesterase [Cyanothece sp. SIO1E1]|nr:acyl-CoA thioesterase [Cyanothece sp. SIO1E1]
MPFIYKRTVRFQDTDAAGVAYFARVLAMCHEAYEASLSESGINLRGFFSGSSSALPIVHADINFYQPLFCGDLLLIQLTAQQLKASEFQNHYQIFAPAEQLAAKAVTRHVCIDPKQRTRQSLPDEILRWLQQE